MPTNVQPKRGMVPMPDNKGTVNIRDLVPVSASNSVALFKGSPYTYSSGEIVGISPGNSQTYCGAVTKLYNASLREVLNLPVETAGYADVTYEKDQNYMLIVDDTGYTSPDDNGLMYNLTAETGTANSNGFDGTGFSTVQVDGSTQNASTRMFVISKIVEVEGNYDDTTGTLIQGIINPANWLAS